MQTVLDVIFNMMKTRFIVLAVFCQQLTAGASV